MPLFTLDVLSLPIFYISSSSILFIYPRYIELFENSYRSQYYKPCSLLKKGTSCS